MVTATADREFPLIRTQVKERQTPAAPLEVRARARNFSLWYRERQALDNISLDIYSRRVTAIIGPSGCGKSTLLRTLNRMNDLIPGVRREGEILLDGEDLYAPDVDVVALRRRVGMVFQQANPFPKSIFDNVAYGLREIGRAHV